MKKLAVCECCGNIFMMGDRVWKYRGDKLCSEECARKAEFLGKQGKWKNDIDKKEKENKKMKEIKLTIDGKEIQLTDEQLKMLGIEPEKKRKNPFKRVAEDEVYFQIGIDGDVFSLYEDRTTSDEEAVLCVNYFNDEEFAKQVSLQQLLYRKLLKFSYDNGFEDTAEWDGVNPHWHIIYNKVNDVFITMKNLASKDFTVYFSTEEGAERAIGEVVKPFMKEHPEFVW